MKIDDAFLNNHLIIVDPKTVLAEPSGNSFSFAAERRVGPCFRRTSRSVQTTRRASDPCVAREVYRLLIICGEKHHPQAQQVRVSPWCHHSHPYVVWPLKQDGPFPVPPWPNVRTLRTPGDLPVFTHSLPSSPRLESSRSASI